MITWFLIIGTIYFIALLYFAYLGKKKNKYSNEDYLNAGSNIGVILGFLTFSATLFSTFTLMGMPNFFRVHGIGSWIFLGVTDVAMAFVALWFGFYFRSHIKNKNFTSMSLLLKESYGSSIASKTYLLGIFIFLVPYVSIQIRGVSVFLDSVLPFDFSMLAWSIIILLFIFIYSSIGGLRAIMYSDALQGVILLVVTWLIASTCLDLLGGDLQTMFLKVKESNEMLLSVPGPKNLFSIQFLIASFLAIILMPISQPQLTMRLAVLKDTKTLKLMAIAIGIFAILVILPTIVIGAYGSVFFANSPAPEFWKAVMVTIQHPFVGAIAIVGLIAAAMSTADSQLFALGTEYSAATGQDRNHMKTKIVLVFFSIAALILSLFSTNELVMLARVSFAGTALLAPMIILAIIKNIKLTMYIPLLTLVSLILFLLSLLKIIPNVYFGYRIDLILLIVLAITAFCLSFSRKQYA